VNVRVPIKKTEIIRVDRNELTGNFQYALQFRNVSLKSDEELKGFIYICQRELLKRRNPVVAKKKDKPKKSG